MILLLSLQCTLAQTNLVIKIVQLILILIWDPTHTSCTDLS